MSETKIAERWAYEHKIACEYGMKNRLITIDPKYYKNIIEELSRAEAQVRQLREVVRRLMLVLPDYRSEVEAMEFARTTLIYTEPKP